MSDVVYPYSSRDRIDHLNNKVMKFVIKQKKGIALLGHDGIPILERLIEYCHPQMESVTHTRYITMYEYKSAS